MNKHTMRSSMILLLGMLAGLSSCKKFLEEKAQSEMTPTTLRDYSELLYGTAYPNSKFLQAQFIHYMDDDVQKYAKASSNDVTAGTILPAYSWQPDCEQRLLDVGFSLGSVKGSYDGQYAKIAGCNIAIHEGVKAIGTQQERDKLEGEALVLRAFYYFNLVNLYGKPYNDSTTTPEKSLGVPLMLTGGLSEKLVPRSSVDAVYRQITADLESGIGKLKKAGGVPSVYRVNELTAKLLLSRVSLFTENWNAVIEQASSVIAEKPDIIDLNGRAAGAVVLANPTNSEVLWLYNAITEINFRGGSIFGVSEDLYSKFEATDLRVSRYFSISDAFILQFNPVKYIGIKTSTSNSFYGKAFRVTEAYLNRAEAYAQQYRISGDAALGQKAIDDLNFVRSKRFAPSNFVPLTMMPGDELLQFCREERRRELFQEGHRWFDLKRYGMPAISHTYVLSNNVTSVYHLGKRDLQYTLQFPTKVMELNPVLEQNPPGPIRQGL